MTLNEILSRIKANEPVSSHDLLPHLSAERPRDRAQVNASLAAAYFASNGKESLEHAKTLIERAWFLSNFNLDLLPLYTEILATAGDVEGIRSAYKTIGIRMARHGRVSEAIRFFDLWHSAYATFLKADKYEYDLDVLESMDSLAAPYRFSRQLRPDVNDGKKVRIAYLLKGITELGSVLMKVIYLLAKYHDPSRFDLMIFAPESVTSIKNSPEGSAHIEAFSRLGYDIVLGPDVATTKERLLAVARAIEGSKPDVLVTSAALANFEQYFISTLHPAPIMIGLLQGPPPLFAPPFLDWAIAWSGHTLLDCPVGCSRSSLGADLKTRSHVTARERSELDVPEGAVIVASAGRYFKFQDRRFWGLVRDVLMDHRDTFYVAIGVTKDQLQFLDEVVPAEIQSRIRFIPWRGDDYLKTLVLADILIDTYPSGGSGILLDALGLAIPCVSFENNYMRLFEQTDWSPADQFINDPDLLAPRGDFDQLKKVVARLITDDSYRAKIAEQSHQYILKTFANPEASVRHCEQIYLQVITDKLSGNTAAETSAREYRDLSGSTRPAISTGFVSWMLFQMKRSLYFGQRMIDRMSERLN